MCGFIGLHLNKPVVSELYEGLFMIQHRGQDSAGIYTFDGNKFHKKKGHGLVDQIFDPESLIRLKGNCGIGHVRYPTVGGGGSEDAQPFTTDHPYGIMMAHNGNIVNYNELKEELIKTDLQLVNSGCDVEIILHVFANGLRKQNPKGHLTPEMVWEAVSDVYKRVKGAYSVVCHIANQGMVAFRDPHGIRPAIWGTRKTGLTEEHCFCSEKVVFDYLGFKIQRDVQPGEAIFIDRKGKVHTKEILPKKQHLCIFEFIYFARPDSIIDKISVQKARYRMGQKLAKQVKDSGIPVDAVVPVPDSGRWPALGLAKELGVDYREGLVKNRYVGRTFIMPGQEERQKSIKRKLTPNIFELRNKNILLVDDSIVRGNTSRKIVELVRNAGAKKVYLASAAPQLISPCLYGVDTPSRKEYVANELSIDEICKSICADALFYQTLDDLVDAVRDDTPYQKDFCLACLDGKYPTGGITDQSLREAEMSREKSVPMRSRLMGSELEKDDEVDVAQRTML